MPAFAAVLLETLELSSYTLEILGAFSSAKAVREAILNQRPTLIHDLLSAATSSSHGFDKVSDICVTLLAEPLPDGLPLPAAAQSFLHQLKDRAIQAPSQSTIEPVYKILDGACAGSLEALAAPELRELRETFSKLIRGRKNDEQYVTTLCLALLAKIHRAASGHNDESWSKEYSRSHKIPGQSHDHSPDFFSGQDSQKSLHMAVTQMIGACSPELQPYSDQTLKHARLLTVIAAEIEEATLKEWVEAKQIILKKLHQKLTLASLHPLICLEVSLSDIFGRAIPDICRASGLHVCFQTQEASQV